MAIEPSERTVAYFTMEIALENDMPTYSGGLGVLAGDAIRAAADLRLPVVAVTLLHRKGYFSQQLDAKGWQSETPVAWAPQDFLAEEQARTSVKIEGRDVALRAWRYTVAGAGGFEIPVYFLDTDLPENDSRDRELTQALYGGDERYRLCQEVILGLGGVSMLRALSYRQIRRFHMNEGHSSLLTLALLDEAAAGAGRTRFLQEDAEAVRRQCVFTTHTPVQAGHDQFPVALAASVLGRDDLEALRPLGCLEDYFNMTVLALNLSGYVNGVAKKHREVSREMFVGYAIDAITNGVHVRTWAAEPLKRLFDRHLSGWREDSFMLRYAVGIPRAELWKAHAEAKHELIQAVNRRTNAGMTPEAFTMGVARRATAYKRMDLLFHDLERLKRVATSAAGPIQVIYAGKAHPRDKSGKRLIARIFEAREQLAGSIRVVYLKNHDLDLGRLMTAGVDLWLNTPQPPLEASGTSGMKAALNGVPSLSILDGWWLEGHLEGVTGWAIDGPPSGAQPAEADRSPQDAAALYDKLERVVIPLYYGERDRWIQIMRQAIAMNGSFFNAHRMMQQYVTRAYFS